MFFLQSDGKARGTHKSKQDKEFHIPPSRVRGRNPRSRKATAEQMEDRAVDSCSEEGISCSENGWLPSYNGVVHSSTHSSKRKIDSLVTDVNVYIDITKKPKTEERIPTRSAEGDNSMTNEKEDVSSAPQSYGPSIEPHNPSSYQINGDEPSADLSIPQTAHSNPLPSTTITDKSETGVMDVDSFTPNDSEVLSTNGDICADMNGSVRRVSSTADDFHTDLFDDVSEVSSVASENFEDTIDEKASIKFMTLFRDGKLLDIGIDASRLTCIVCGNMLSLRKKISKRCCRCERHYTIYGLEWPTRRQRQRRPPTQTIETPASAETTIELEKEESQTLEPEKERPELRRKKPTSEKRRRSPKKPFHQEKAVSVVISDNIDQPATDACNEQTCHDMPDAKPIAAATTSNEESDPDIDAQQPMNPGSTDGDYYPFMSNGTLCDCCMVIRSEEAGSSIKASALLHPDCIECQLMAQMYSEDNANESLCPPQDSPLDPENERHRPTALQGDDKYDRAETLDKPSTPPGNPGEGTGDFAQFSQVVDQQVDTERADLNHQPKQPKKATTKRRTSKPKLANGTVKGKAAKTKAQEKSSDGQPLENVEEQNAGSTVAVRKGKGAVKKGKGRSAKPKPSLPVGPTSMYSLLESNPFYGPPPQSSSSAELSIEERMANCSLEDNDSPSLYPGTDANSCQPHSPSHLQLAGHSPFTPDQTVITDNARLVGSVNEELCSFSEPSTNNLPSRQPKSAGRKKKPRTPKSKGIGPKAVGDASLEPMASLTVPTNSDLAPTSVQTVNPSLPADTMSEMLYTMEAAPGVREDAMVNCGDVSSVINGESSKQPGSSKKKGKAVVRKIAKPKLAKASRVRQKKNASQDTQTITSSSLEPENGLHGEQDLLQKSTTGTLQVPVLSKSKIGALRSLESGDEELSLAKEYLANLAKVQENTDPKPASSDASTASFQAPAQNDTSERTNEIEDLSNAPSMEMSDKVMEIDQSARVNASGNDRMQPNATVSTEVSDGLVQAQGKHDIEIPPSTSPPKSRRKPATNKPRKKRQPAKSAAAAAPAAASASKLANGSSVPLANCHPALVEEKHLEKPVIDGSDTTAVKCNGAQFPKSMVRFVEDNADVSDLSALLRMGTDPEMLLYRRKELQRNVEESNAYAGTSHNEQLRKMQSILRLEGDITSCLGQPVKPNKPEEGGSLMFDLNTTFSTMPVKAGNYRGSIFC
ncbi:uncharacterized protein BYT42DRAFT_19458 [Radiomyces spectabilis]|uniref:uncharacterized protein n=1 Tax=Radiomyces spectabilis TaxID=64574 RepID=UPI00221FA105|nr:uncharacterized protein BYT42DRAFT_19458 [Radiomyces spectabilis]KAI8393810.1 hypothetical protein BYT42DRAFT_19458 [Radiomyces spectabilis]